MLRLIKKTYVIYEWPLRSNDLVIYDEFKLFDCISRWLTSRKAIMENSGEENIDLHFDRYVF